MKSDEQEKKFKIKAGMKPRTIHVDYLARVEGEGAMLIKTSEGKIEKIELQIFEPPRFFEGFLRGRYLTDAPDITARICGICPVAYQMSSVGAMENALNIEVPEYIQQLRRLIYCGEWIESHALHVIMLHAPDFLKLNDVIELSKIHPEIVKKSLHLKKTGNELIKLLAGREVHPINVRVGGFYKLPKKRDLLALEEDLKVALDEALALTKWVSGLEFPDLNRSYNSVCINYPGEYPLARGRVISSSGLDIDPSEYDTYFKEEHVQRSTSLHSHIVGQGAYLTGPVARYNNCSHLLPPLVQELIQEIQFEKVCTNPYRSIIVRSLELVFACVEALRIIHDYAAEKEAPFIPFEPRPATGFGVSEAPRGLLYHRYKIDANGVIKDAKIVAPTSQNQPTIEEDLFDFVSQHPDLSDNELCWKCEQAIRNYDPCISCSCHFLNLKRIDE